MKLKYFNMVIVAGMVFLLSQGCLSVPRSPSARFYTLQSAQGLKHSESFNSAQLNDIVIGIGPVALPDYFNRPHIVTKNRDNTIEFAQFDRWGESLDVEMGRVIAKNLSLFLPSANIEIFPWHSVIPIKYQLLMEVIDLDCRLNGQVDMLVQWTVLDSQEKKMLFTRRSEYKRGPGSSGYPSIVKAISEICESVSVDAAKALIELETKKQFAS